MSVTAISDREAANLINVSYGTIRNAVKRGDLVRVPRSGQVQHVAKEQVLLFHGKTQLVAASLTKDERRAWEEIEGEIKGVAANIVQPVGAPRIKGEAITMPLFNIDRSALEYLYEHNLTMQADTPVGSTSFRSALSDQPDNNSEDLNAIALSLDTQNTGIVSLFLLAFFILLGLIWLFNQSNERLQKMATTAEKITASMGLEKEDVFTNHQKVVKTLKQHPQEAKKLKTIIDEGGYKSPFAA